MKEYALQKLTNSTAANFVKLFKVRNRLKIINCTKYYFQDYNKIFQNTTAKLNLKWQISEQVQTTYEIGPLNNTRKVRTYKELII